MQFPLSMSPSNYDQHEFVTLENLVLRYNQHSKSPFTVCHSADKLINIPVSSDCKCKGRLQTKDEVNYAVSEREDGVMGVTTLKRMRSCTGLYWAVLDWTGLQL